MTDELGYARFAIRASDFGAGVSEDSALAHSERLVGLHHSGTSPFVYGVPDDLSPAERAFLAEAQAFQRAEGADAMLRSTKPQSLAAGRPRRLAPGEVPDLERQRRERRVRLHQGPAPR